MSKKVSIITLGCAKNQNDTENLAGLLKKRGYDMAASPEAADAIVVHTCSFIDAAKRESIETILQAGQAKGEKKKLIVSGCMVQQHGKEMMEELPEVDAFLGTGQLAQIPDFLDKPRARFLDRRDPGGLTDPDAPRELKHDGPSAFLRLSEGCSHPCSFCVIPKLRGSLQSRSPEKILDEARALINKGVEEISIIGQDTGDWGRDISGQRELPSLLRRLRELKGLRWIRLMYMHPHSFTDDLLNVFAESPEMFPYLDMPLQHIDDKMLTEMNRLMGEAPLRAKLDLIKKRVPNLSLRTTFIVGYPGETDEQFEKLNRFAQEGYFNYLGAFTYSQEENTPAAVRTDQVPDDVKRERHAALMASYMNYAHQNAQKRIGKVETVLLEDSEEDLVYGRTAQEAPEIDAVIKMPRSAARGGRFIKAKITGYEAFEYTAQIAP